MLTLKDISKRFGAVQALDHVSFEVGEGSIHGLVGQNGAGKSTLMRILAGAVQADEGSIHLNGAELEVKNPAHARTLGIAMIHQELNLSPYQTVAENISLGIEPRAYGLVDRHRLRRRATDALALLEAPIPLEARIESLSIGDQQIVEIAKALAWDSRVLILDEPTAALEARQAQRLFEILRRFRARRGTVLYVSHRLDEVFELCDRITILRDGRVAGSTEAASASRGTVIQLMIGRPLVDMFPPRNTSPNGAAILEGHGLAGSTIRSLDFAAKAGSIIGLAGLEGSGVREIGRMLVGDQPPRDGTLTIDGRPVSIRSPRAALRHGIVYVSSDRRREGLFPILSVRDNIAVGTLERRVRCGLIRLRQEQAVVAQSVARLGIKTHRVGQEVRRLSGGNQQKVLLARWLSAQPRIVVLDEPTRGIDIGARREIYEIMRAITDGGAAVVMISSDLTETIGMADEIVAIRRGAVADTFAGGATEADVLHAIL